MANVKEFKLNDTTVSVKDATAREDIATLETTVSNLSSTLGTVSENVTTLQNDVTTLTGTVSNLSDDMTAVEKAISDLQAADTALQTNISAVAELANAPAPDEVVVNATTSAGGYVNLGLSIINAVPVAVFITSHASHSFTPVNNGNNGWGGYVLKTDGTKLTNTAVTMIVFYFKRKGA